ncbi:3-keto-disaccharide hydrolase [Rubrolithibacter danxiaensis]|uniref:3-keto-disaccharide hydrolase n=1 Tax=Rubrolithibacter danxiaensis TaxID=3390805 RepID=UPI003BF8948A
MVSYFLSALIVAASLIGKNDQQDSATAAKHNPAPQKGWVALFDGKTTKGWHTYGKNSVSDSWKVDDGTLHLTVSDKEGSHGGGDIVTNEEFSNYHLKLDWKIAPGGNSGIIFFVKEDPAKFPNTYNSGMEMQVLDNEGHPDAKIHKHRAGDLYDLIASSKETVKPAGEWNHAEIVSNNGKLDFFLNGTKVVSTTMWDDNWKKMIAGSKFAKMPGFGTFTSGKIALQDHGNEVWYKNIMIKRL